jgi:hypothetical protein
MTASSRNIRRIAIAAGTLIVVAALSAYLHASMTPPEELDYSRTRATEGGAYRATIAPSDSVLKVGRMHSWTLHLVTADGAAVEAATIEVDGGMPQHGHGYPTRPRVTRSLGGGGYLVEGVKFNMGGWWTMKFTVDAAAGQDSVTFNLRL